LIPPALLCKAYDYLCGYRSYCLIQPLIISHSSEHYSNKGFYIWHRLGSQLS
jgi:hypothetical protein